MENPTLTKSSSRNSTTQYSFSFQIYPASKLKIAIDAFTEKDFNDLGVGMIEVTKDKCDIIVPNFNAKRVPLGVDVVAYLGLQASALIKFCYRNYPSGKKIIYLNEIAQFLSQACDDDVISVYNVHGSNELCFALGELSSSVKMTVRLHELPICLSNFSVTGITCECEAVISSEDLRRILSSIESSETKLVQLFMVDTEITVLVQGKHILLDKGAEVEGMVEGEQLRVSFLWLSENIESLKKASYVANEVTLCPLIVPADNFLFGFNFGELGDLMYIKLDTKIDTLEPLNDEELASAVSKPSKNQQAMAETSSQNTNLSFSFLIVYATKLKHAVEALCDDGFNRDGIAMIKVTPRGFEITVLNGPTTIGHYCLEAKFLINFRCNNPLEKLVNLNKISEILSSAANGDTITIYHVNGSEELSFLIGDHPSSSDGEFSVRLHDITVRIFGFPAIMTTCDALVDSTDLREIIEQLEACEYKLVKFVLTDTSVSITLGEQYYQWDHVYEPFLQGDDDQKQGIRGMQPGDERRAWFFWSFCESLKKASYASYGVRFCPLLYPPKSMLLKIHLQELGDLIYIKEALITQPSTDQQKTASGSSTSTDDEIANALLNLGI